MNCKICGSISTSLYSAKILDAHMITYYQCGHCGFVQTEEPYWLEEAYSKPINTSDTGIIARNLANARMVSAILYLCFDPNSKYADYGGGHGIFVRMMRDRGFDFYREDKYCENLFANGFDVADSGIGQFELLTAFEVFEHFVSPGKELVNLLQKSENILFTTEILPKNTPHPTAWWYYGLDHGQHISFFTHKSIQCLADKFGLTYYYRGSIHLFTRQKSALKFRFQVATCNRFNSILEIIYQKRSLTNSDYKFITGNNIKNS
jgi:hypothetical protein